MMMFDNIESWNVKDINDINKMLDIRGCLGW